jgi:hypothetical protein
MGAVVDAKGKLGDDNYDGDGKPNAKIALIFRVQTHLRIPGLILIPSYESE